MLLAETKLQVVTQTHVHGPLCSGGFVCVGLHQTPSGLLASQCWDCCESTTPVSLSGYSGSSSYLVPGGDQWLATFPGGRAAHGAGKVCPAFPSVAGHGLLQPKLVKKNTVTECTVQSWGLTPAEIMLNVGINTLRAWSNYLRKASLRRLKMNTPTGQG